MHLDVVSNTSGACYHYPSCLSHVLQNGNAFLIIILFFHRAVYLRYMQGFEYASYSFEKQTFKLLQKAAKNKSAKKQLPIVNTTQPLPSLNIHSAT